MYLKLHSAVPFFFLFLPGRKKKKKKRNTSLSWKGQANRKEKFTLLIGAIQRDIS